MQVVKSFLALHEGAIACDSTLVGVLHQVAGSYDVRDVVLLRSWRDSHGVLLVVAQSALVLGLMGVVLLLLSSAHEVLLLKLLLVHGRGLVSELLLLLLV